MGKWVITVCVALMIVSITAVSFSIFYRPNIQITRAEIPKPMISHGSLARNLAYSLLCRGSYTFSYPANESTSVHLWFSNDEGFLVPKVVSFTYSIDGNQPKTDSFSLPPFATKYLQIYLLPGQVLHGNLSVSGSLINDIYFSFNAQTITQSINFSFTLVNTG